MSRTFEVTVPDDYTLGLVFNAVVEAVEPGASKHTLVTRMDEVLRLSVTHSRLGVTVTDITKTRRLHPTGDGPETAA